tara:strand:- start:13 stop:147 length:135 start_codon:yes stop_codon:yes gene_type:complete
MVSVITPATLVFSIMLRVKNEVSALADTGLLDGLNMADRKYIPL